VRGRGRKEKGKRGEDNSRDLDSIALEPLLVEISDSQGATRIDCERTSQNREGNARKQSERSKDEKKGKKNIQQG
jgi:hypothetical protein